MARNIFKMGEEGFNREQPVDSIKDLNESLVNAFGKATAKIMLTTSVKCCFEGDKSTEILQDLRDMGLFGENR